MSYKFQQKPVSGERYIRCSQVVIDNRLGTVPLVTFSREAVIGIEGGEVIHQPLSPRLLPFDPAAAVPILNPETGEATGATITQGSLYALVYSIFIAAETSQPEATEGDDK